MNLTDKITITNEDCMELMSRYPDKYFELAIVDPPYGIGEDGERSTKVNVTDKWKSAKAKNYKLKNWDNEYPNKLYFNELQRISQNQIIWGANHFIENIPNANSSCWIVWDKDNGDNDFSDCELAYASFKTAVRKFKWLWNGFQKQKPEKRWHPTQKPVALYKWLLTKYANQGDKILDTHLGSGSIAIACHDLGFELTGCELDTDYFNAAVKRINNHTAQLGLF